MPAGRRGAGEQVPTLLHGILIHRGHRLQGVRTINVEVTAVQRSARCSTSLAWSLVNWWAHDGFHRVAGLNFGGLIRIEHGFHVSLILGGVLTAYFLLSVTRVASRFTDRVPAERRPPAWRVLASIHDPRLTAVDGTAPPQLPPSATTGVCRLPTQHYVTIGFIERHTHWSPLPLRSD